MAANTGTAWSPEADDRLRDLWGQRDESGGPKLSATMIGREMGLSKNAVLGRVHRLHLPARESVLPGGRYVHREWTDADRQTLKELRTAGHPFKVIGAQLNRTPEAVRVRWVKEGWAPPRALQRTDAASKRIKRAAAAKKQSSRLSLTDGPIAELAAQINGGRIAHRTYYGTPLAEEAPEETFRFDCNAVTTPYTVEHRGCAWMINGRRPWLICAEKVELGRPYCMRHLLASMSRAALVEAA